MTEHANLTRRQTAVHEALKRTPVKDGEWATPASIAEHVEGIEINPSGVGQVLGALARMGLCRTNHTGTQREYLPNA